MAEFTVVLYRDDARDEALTTEERDRARAAAPRALVATISHPWSAQCWWNPLWAAHARSDSSAVSAAARASSR